MSLRIRNSTHFRGDDLRRFILAAHRAKGVDGEPAEVTVDYARQTGVRAVEGATFYGWGYYPQRGRSRRWRIALPRIDALSPAQIRCAAQIAEHEIDHTLGLRHADMAPWWKLPAAWAEGLEIRKREPRKQAKPACADEHLAKAEAALERIEELEEREKARHRTNLKRLATRKRKAKAALRYRQKKAQEAGGAEIRAAAASRKPG